LVSDQKAVGTAVHRHQSIFSPVFESHKVLPATCLLSA
jgi:hypothetical protein